MTDAARPSTKDRSASFATLIKKFPATPPPLPLCYAAGGPRLRTLIEEDRIQPEAAPHVREPALVLSYGRPVYQTYAGVIEPTLNYFCPVVMLFDGSLCKEAARVFPFDSLAWRHYGMAPDPWRGVPLQDFDLSGVRDAPQRVVSGFYGSNRNYLSGTAMLHRQMSRRGSEPLQVYADWLGKLNTPDEPLPSTIEAHFDQPVTLSTHLRAIVVPTFFLADRIISDFLVAFGVATYAYSFYGGRSSRYPQLIEALLMAHLETLGVLDHE